MLLVYHGIVKLSTTLAFVPLVMVNQIGHHLWMLNVLCLYNDLSLISSNWHSCTNVYCFTYKFTSWNWSTITCHVFNPGWRKIVIIVQPQTQSTTCNAAPATLCPVDTLRTWWKQWQRSLTSTAFHLRFPQHCCLALLNGCSTNQFTSPHPSGIVPKPSRPPDGPRHAIWAFAEVPPPNSP